MKKGLKILVSFLAAMVLMMSVSIISYAKDDFRDLERQAKEVTNTEVYRTANLARIIGAVNGSLISSVDVQLENEGWGVANIYADVLCHKPMSSIRMVLMLQKWNEEHEAWDTIDRQEFQWNAEDLPSGEELTMASVSYNIAGMQTGAVYRVRGLFGAYDLEGTHNEAWNANTDGIIF